MLTNKILMYAREAYNYIIERRRDFHKYPETGFLETRTSHVIAEELKRMGFSVQSGIAKTGVVGILEVSGAKSTVAFRADMDALPIAEENDLEFKSQNEGLSHACGHDASMAMLLGTARIITQLKDDLKRQVKLIFQPSEETPPGGAKLMLEQGILDGVDEIYGLHIDPTLSSGFFGVREGAAMASTDRIAITITGKGGHASTPHLCIDPILIAAEVIVSLQTIVSRKVDPLLPCVLSLCQISGGTTFNVIPSTVNIIGTVRSFDPDLRIRMPLLIEETVKGITRYHNASYQLEYINGYPSLHNPSVQVNFVRNKIVELFGSKAVKTTAPKLGGEDFAYYLEKIGGAFIFLGTGNTEKNANQPLHSPRFLLDEDVLFMGPALFTHIACSP